MRTTGREKEKRRKRETREKEEKGERDTALVTKGRGPWGSQGAAPLPRPNGMGPEIAVGQSPPTPKW